MLSSADLASGVRKYFKRYVTWDETIVSGKRELICNHKQIFEHKFGRAVRIERVLCRCHFTLIFLLADLNLIVGLDKLWYGLFLLVCLWLLVPLSNIMTA